MEKLKIITLTLGCVFGLNFAAQATNQKNIKENLNLNNEIKSDSDKTTEENENQYFDLLQKNAFTEAFKQINRKKINKDNSSKEDLKFEPLQKEIKDYIKNESNKTKLRQNKRNNNIIKFKNNSAYFEEDNKDEIDTTNQNRNNQENLRLKKERFAKRANRISQLNNSQTSSEEELEEINLENLNKLSDDQLLIQLEETIKKMKMYINRLFLLNENYPDKKKFYIKKINKYNRIKKALSDIVDSRLKNNYLASSEEDVKEEFFTTNLKNNNKFKKRTNRIRQLNNSQTSSEEDLEEINIENLNKLADNHLKNRLKKTEKNLEKYLNKFKQLSENQPEKFDINDSAKRNFYIEKIHKYSKIKKAVSNIINSRLKNNFSSYDEDSKEKISTSKFKQKNNNRKRLEYFKKHYKNDVEEDYIQDDDNNPFTNMVANRRNVNEVLKNEDRNSNIITKEEKGINTENNLREAVFFIKEPFFEIKELLAKLNNIFEPILNVINDQPDQEPNNINALGIYELNGQSNTLYPLINNLYINIMKLAMKKDVKNLLEKIRFDKQCVGDPFLSYTGTSKERPYKAYIDVYNAAYDLFLTIPNNRNLQLYNEQLDYPLDDTISKYSILKEKLEHLIAILDNYNRH